MTVPASASPRDVFARERQEHIITIEDPVEYLHSHKKCIVNQRELGADARGIDFLPFSDLEQSVRDDVELLRSSPLISKDVRVTGFIYDVTTGKIHEVDVATFELVWKDGRENVELLLEALGDDLLGRRLGGLDAHVALGRQQRRRIEQQRAPVQHVRHGLEQHEDRRAVRLVVRQRAGKPARRRRRAVILH